MVALAVALTTALVTWLVLFAVNLYLVEKLPGSSLVGTPGPVETGVSVAPSQAAMLGGVQPGSCETSPYPPLAPKEHAGNLIHLPTDQVWAYLPYIPERGYASLDTGKRHIDVLLPDLYRIERTDGSLYANDRELEEAGYVDDLVEAERGRMKVLPVATVMLDALRTDEEGPVQRSILTQNIVAAAEAERADGFCLMPEGGLDDAQLDALADLLARLDTGLEAQGRQSCLIAGPDDAILGNPAFDGLVDHFVYKAFSKPWIGDPPAPLATQARFAAEVEAALEAVGRKPLVVMLGSFGVDWTRGEAVPQTISVAEAFARVGRNRGALDFPQAAGNLRLRFTDAAGRAHETWALDAVSLYNQMSVLADHEIRQVGIWALGYEDPTIWPLLAAKTITPDLAALYVGYIDLSGFVSYEGQGPFHQLLRRASPGRRFIEFGDDGRTAVAQGCAPVPTPAIVRKFGDVPPEKVAITFDDGPDPAFTDDILDVLKEKEATATFFVVGANALRWPDIVRRMYDEGHEIGSHTFLHPWLNRVPDLRTKIELNAMQRLLEAITGRGTVLFRTPYGRGDGPITGDTAGPLALVEEGGYVIVGSDVVPPDWEDAVADDLVHYAMQALATKGGNVIVLHDSGGDRTATVEMLGPLIDHLRTDGYEIVSLADMLGVSRDAVMPAAGGPRLLLDQASFGLIAAMGRGITVVFWVIVVAGVFRSSVMLLMAHMRRPHRAAPPDRAPTPPVTVLIPAFNEEKTIIRCIRSVFASDYPDIRVIVIDDGSTDHTFETVAGYAQREPRLRLVHEPNAGKWAALDRAYSLLETEIVVAIDADSMVARDAISQLVRHFEDPDIGAVAGKVRVGNRRGLLTRLQALEYLTAQNIDRRAAELLNGMLVVPGAIGAWRATAVRAAGLYSSQTVTEDADLTVAVIRAGYRVVYEPAAYAVTEAPETVGAFLRQRLRWAFGMLQTAVKHLPGAFRQRKAVGVIMLPDLLVVGFGLAALAPLADLILLSTLADFAIDKLLGRPQPLVDTRNWVLLGYLALPLFDILLILAAMRFDRSESLKLLLLFPFQRFFYRQLLYFTAWRAMGRAAFGKLASWGKLARTGTAVLPGEDDDAEIVEPVPVRGHIGE